MSNYLREFIVDLYKKYHKQHGLVLTSKEIEIIKDFVEWLHDIGFIIIRNPDDKITEAEFHAIVERAKKRQIKKRDPSYITSQKYNTVSNEGFGATVATNVKEEDPDIIKDTEESG